MTFGAVEEYGGVVSCLYDGVFAEPHRFSVGSGNWLVSDVGDSVTLYQPAGSTIYRGTIVSSDRVAGDVFLPILGQFDDQRSHGTWEMIRSH